MYKIILNPYLDKWVIQIKVNFIWISLLRNDDHTKLTFDTREQAKQYAIDSGLDKSHNEVLFQ